MEEIALPHRLTADKREIKYFRKLPSATSFTRKTLKIMDDITKGKLEVYCECVAKGCKPVALLEALVPKISFVNNKRVKVDNPTQGDVEDFLKEAKPIIDEWGLKFYLEYFVSEIECNGRTYKTKNYDLWIYKNNRDLSRIKKVIKLSESQDEKKYHRQFGRLLGYFRRSE